MLISICLCRKKGSNIEQEKGTLKEDSIITDKNLTINKRIAILDSLYCGYQIAANPSRQSRILKSFFLFFPDNFSSFIDLYGYKEIYSDSVIYSPLYDASFEHIELLFASNKVIDNKIFP